MLRPAAHVGIHVLRDRTACESRADKFLGCKSFGRRGTQPGLRLCSRLESWRHRVDHGIPEVEKRRDAPQRSSQLDSIVRRNELDALPDLHNELCRTQTRSFTRTGGGPEPVG